MKTEIKFPRFFSVDSPKAIKAQGYGFMNAINYMAPHNSGDGVRSLCSHASPGCIALCLGEHSGQAAMVSRITGTNVVRDSRQRKARYFLNDRRAFMCEATLHIAKEYRATKNKARRSKRKALKLVVRMNGATDIPWESIRFMVDAEFAADLESITGHAVAPGSHSVMTLFPYIQFVDYTKNPRRFDRVLPANYDLTFSRSESNESDALALLARGINVAVVFADRLPETWNGFRVIDGDKHDLRHLDEKGGNVVGLLPKGNKAKRDESGFVVRNAA